MEEKEIFEICQSVDSAIAAELTESITIGIILKMRKVRKHTFLKKKFR